MGKRVLVAARLSRADGEASRIERDDEAARRWAEQNGRIVVATSVDAGVSGSVSAFARKGLGPWLTDPLRMAEYDELVASSIDRLGRSFRDMCSLRDWCDDNGKAITVLDPPLHWPPDEGDIATPIIWDLLSRFSEAELRQIKKRHRDARSKIESNRAFVGKPPFGFEVVGERYSKTIQPTPELAGILREAVRRATRGDTIVSIAHWLDTQAPCPSLGKLSKGKVVTGWAPCSVKQLLRNRALIGERVSKQTGKVDHRHEPLISKSEWYALQAAIDHGTRPKGRNRRNEEVSLLSGVIECELCGRPMTRLTSNRPRKNGPTKTYVYYRCYGSGKVPSTCKNQIRMELAEKAVEFHFHYTGGPVVRLAGSFAQLEVVEQVVVSGSDHSAEIAEIEDRLRALDYDSPSFGSEQTELLAERRRLQALPATASEVIERPTGRTVGDVWDGLDQAARRRYLLASGVRLLVHPAKGAHMTGDPSRITSALRTLAS